MRGADISYFSEMDEEGVKFYKNDKETPLFDILKAAGVNYIRLRLWCDSESGFNDLEETVKMARRVKENGFKFLLDIHYSSS